MYSHFEKEKRINTIIHNGKIVEKIMNKENNNGNIIIENIVNQGFINKGKLRKKRVSFSSVQEFIEPKNAILNSNINNPIDRTLTPYYNNKLLKNKKKYSRKNKRNSSRKNKK